MPEVVVSNIYRVVVTGKQLIADLDEIRSRVLEIFDLPEKQLEALLGGKALVIKKNVDEMVEARKVGNKITKARDKAIHYCDNVKPYFDTIKYHVDKLEMLIDDELWPLPKLRELLFTK